LLCLAPQLVYYYDSRRQPRIKHEDPLRRFELSRCFLITIILVIIVIVAVLANTNERLYIEE